MPNNFTLTLIIGYLDGGALFDDDAAAYRAIGAAPIPQDLAIVSALFCDDAQGLGIDLAFQDFAAELATLPGKYAARLARYSWPGVGWKHSAASPCAR